jgi:hypothetical protein
MELPLLLAQPGFGMEQLLFLQQLKFGMDLSGLVLANVIL